MEKEIIQATEISALLIKEISNAMVWIKENMVSIILIIIQVAAVIIIALLIITLTRKITKMVVSRKNAGKSQSQSRRIATIATVVQSIIFYAVVFIAIVIILSMVGAGAVVAASIGAASIGGIAIGFGAQSLVKDVFMGFFILIEDQYAVGDYIKTQEAEGHVEEISLRITRLRSLRGDNIVIPNGSIERVINYTKSSYSAIIDIATAYESDTRMVIQIIDRAAQSYADAHPALVADRPQVMGITSFDHSSVNIRTVCLTRHMKMAEVERGIRLAIKEAFDASGTPFPYPHMVIMNSTAQQDASKLKKKAEQAQYQYSQPPSQTDRIIPVWQQGDY